MSYYFLKNMVTGKSDYLLGQLATKAETIRIPIGSLYDWISIEELEKELAQVKELNKSMFEVINFYRHENGQEEMLDTEQYKKEYFEEKK